MKLETETFYFRGGGTFNKIQLIALGGKPSCVVINNGFNSLEGYPADTIINLLDSIPYSDLNVKELKKFHEALGKYLDGPKPTIRKESVRSKIRTRHSYTKTLAEYISMVEVCVVEFESGGAAYIGEYIDLLTGSDCIIFNETIEHEDEIYDVTDLAIGKNAMNYFRSIHGEVPTKCYFTSDSDMFSAIKLKFGAK